MLCLRAKLTCEARVVLLELKAAVHSRWERLRLAICCQLHKGTATHTQSYI